MSSVYKCTNQNKQLNMPKTTPPHIVRWLRIYGKYYQVWQCANFFGISECTVKKYRKPKYKRWGYSEVEYLKANYKKMSNIAISEELKRTSDEVRHKLIRLGLKRSKAQLRKIRKNDFNKRIKEAFATHQRWKIAKIRDVLTTQNDLLKEMIVLRQLIDEAAKNGNENNHEVIQAKKDLAKHEETERQIESMYYDILPIKKKNRFLV